MIVPVLKNQKWERFAQEVAKGKTADEAYQLAGYTENRGNATRLKANESIRERVAEIQGKTADLTSITAANLTQKLMSIAEMGNSFETVGGYDLSRKALMDVAKLNGLIIERQDHTSSDGSMSPPTRIELVPLNCNDDSKD